MIWLILLLLFIILLGGIRWALTDVNKTNVPDSNVGEWPVLARISNRNEAYMAKALLEDAGIEAIVEEDTTLGVLYGVQNITDYPIRVARKDRNMAQGILKESSFEPHLE